MTWSKIVQPAMSARVTLIVTPPAIMGQVTLRKTWILPAPSIRAASSSS
jgi:hypothetical protein